MKWNPFFAAATLLMLVLTGCGAPGTGSSASVGHQDVSVQTDGEPDTGDAGLDNPRNQDGIGEKELLVVSFGTSYNENRAKTIGSIEAALERAFPEYAVRRAFTSQTIIDRVKKRDGAAIDNVEQALERAAANGVRTLVVQPTHLMNGLEYQELVDKLAEYSDAFEKIAVGQPLLTSPEDVQAVMEAMVQSTSEYEDGKTAICFMGHGTEADSNRVYGEMQTQFSQSGHTNYFVGTVEAQPTVEDVLAGVRQGPYERVVLLPMMIVAGDHANNDMAGDEEDSWKSVFQGAGYEVECVLRGFGELEAVQAQFAAHAQAAMDTL